MLNYKCQQKLLDGVKGLCEKYNVKYLRCSEAGSVLNGVEVKLKDNWVFWITTSGIDFRSSPIGASVDELVRLTSLTHKVSTLLKDNWKRYIDNDERMF